MKNKAIFLDRDGTIIEDYAYNSSPDRICLLPGVAGGLATLQDRGFLLVVVTNQSGIGRGYFGAEIVDAQHRRLTEILAAAGVRLAAVYYCPHGPEDACVCRKPSPGMLVQAARELAIDLENSWMIGDKDSDVQAGKKAGCRGIRLGPPEAGGDWQTAENFEAAVTLILAHESAARSI